VEKRIKHIYFIAFFVVLLAPNVAMLLDWKVVDDCENRALAKAPELAFNKPFFTDFEKYYNDHFGWRNAMVHANSKIKFTVFNSSPKPNKVVMGKDGWLYFTSEKAHMYQSLSRTELYSTQELQNMQKRWEARSAGLAQRGIAFTHIFFPNKPTVYPEFMPNNLAAQIADTISRADQVLHYLEQNNSTHSIVDLRQSFAELKQHQLLYCKHDSHWNDLGAYYAYVDLMKSLNIEPYPIEAFAIEWKTTHHGDLFKLMGLCAAKENEELLPQLTLKTDSLGLPPMEIELKGNGWHKNTGVKNGKRIILFRDSYGTALLPFVRLHFEDAHFPWTEYNQSMVDSLKPDVVVVAQVERHL